MKAIRPLVVALSLCVIVLASACGDRSPTAIQPPPPLPAPNASIIGWILKPTGLLSCSQLPYDIQTKTIGLAGGSISVGPHTLYIPPGALITPTAITAELPLGLGVNAVKFRPAGLVFLQPAYLSMSYANCSLLGKLLPKRIAYTTDALDILEYLLSLDNLFGKRVTGQVHHFSDYVVAW